MLNWNDEILNTLRVKLEKSGCINIMSGEPVRIEYRYSGLGLFSYYVFSQPLSDEMIHTYTKEFRDSIISKNVVVIYTSAL
jgi:hypothetical protein